MFPYRQNSSARRQQAASLTEKLSGQRLDTAIKRCQDFLLSIQHPEGYWWAELESNVSITAQAVLLYKVLGIGDSYPLKKMETYLRQEQRNHGGWELFYGDGGELSMSVEAYMALRLLDVPTSDPALQNARRFILDRGGISKTRIFTKLHLALIGCYDWRGIPSLPPWLILLPNWFLTNVYEMSSWARSCIIPLIVVYDQKPVFATTPAINLDELYAEGRKNAQLLPTVQDKWSSLFLYVDCVLKLAEKLHLVPFRTRALKEVEKWILARQEESGDWGGYTLPTTFSILALSVLGYEVSEPILERGLNALRNFSIETQDRYWVQISVSPVWDTALVVRSLVDSGFPSDHPSLVRAGEWLLRKQIFKYGDWAVKNSANAMPGGWAFEFHNTWYPDVDDTATVVMALSAVRLNATDEPLKQSAIARAVKWISSMQCKAGGWAAFDKDNNQDWLNATPYGDLKGMIDPNTADITARVLEMVGKLKMHGLSNYDEGDDAAASFMPNPTSIHRGLTYLRKEQEKEGCWYGRWGVNYLYGTSGVLVALSLIAPKTHEAEIERGANWLMEVQRNDGGWGETCLSYTNTSPVKGEGEGSTASQTAWALIGLMAAGGGSNKLKRDVQASIDRGIEYLLSSQMDDGSWSECWYTGTGFPGHFYMKYHLYAQHFPLAALGRYRNFLQQKLQTRKRNAD